ncbi:hypothetical protein OFY17_13575 [Marinomonas sp. C2222]|uniref:Uncharacterized protein n=1 Tax=Marinomonas sargassi TaxID=2984494 RepID=A0ABT2YVI4_9GAMM|nr:hypothetical protein [Marinomonas sargassi]MCV2403896.1 hypothetical protein [Marinomonas sargassi]
MLDSCASVIDKGSLLADDVTVVSSEYETDSSIYAQTAVVLSVGLGYTKLFGKTLTVCYRVV